MPAPAVLVHDLVKRYDGRAVVDGVSLTAERGAITAVLGPNGAGKTTTVECCEGLRSPDGGRVEARCGVDGAWAWFEVADSGIGMTPETRARIFEKFYRAPDIKRSEPRGLGLGLSIAQRLVAAHDGEFDVESEPGQGSTFRVRLPRVPSTAGTPTGGIAEKSHD